MTIISLFSFILDLRFDLTEWVQNQREQIYGTYFHKLFITTSAQTYFSICHNSSPLVQLKARQGFL